MLQQDDDADPEGEPLHDRQGNEIDRPPETVIAALTASHRRADKFAVGEPITTDNYGRVADTLRRDLRVAQVICLRTS